MESLECSGRNIEGSIPSGPSLGRRSGAHCPATCWVSCLEYSDWNTRGSVQSLIVFQPEHYA